jgi:hypothetical protein
MGVDSSHRAQNTMGRFARLLPRFWAAGKDYDTLRKQLLL